MKGWEYIILGLTFAIVTGILEFGFNFKVNACFMSIGMAMGGVLIYLFEKTTSRN